MQCFTLFLLMTANKILTQLPHTEKNDSTIKRKKSIDVIIKYNVGKYWWLCREIYMCLGTIPYISFIEILLSYSWSWYQCPRTQQRCGWRPQCNLQALYIYQVIYNVQIPVSKTFDSQILMYLAHKTMMSVWLNNSKNICLRRIGNMKSLIRENIETDTVKKRDRQIVSCSG